MRAKVVRIGNSRGIRIPRQMLASAGLESSVVLEVVEGGLLVRPAPAFDGIPHVTPARTPGRVPPMAPELANGRLLEELARDREDR